MMKRLFIICLCFILLVAAFGCKAKPSTEAEKASSVFQATIIEIKDGAMLVKPVDGYPEANYAELINVIIQHMSSLSALRPMVFCSGCRQIGHSKSRNPLTIPPVILS